MKKKHHSAWQKKNGNSANKIEKWQLRGIRKKKRNSNSENRRERVNYANRIESQTMQINLRERGRDRETLLLFEANS